jgi:hypothetical protein
VSLSRPGLTKARCRSISRHAEHMKVRRSKPGTGMLSSGTTFIRIISASQTIQRISRTPNIHRAPEHRWHYTLALYGHCGNTLWPSR